MEQKSEQLEQLLAGYIDGTLTADELRQVEALLSSDPKLAAEMKALVDDSEMLRRLPTTKAPIDFSDALGAQQERELLLGGPAPIARPQRLGVPAYAVAAMVLMGVAIGVVAWTILGDRPGLNDAIALNSPKAGQDAAKDRAPDSTTLAETAAARTLDKTGDKLAAAGAAPARNENLPEAAGATPADLAAAITPPAAPVVASMPSVAAEADVGRALPGFAAMSRGYADVDSALSVGVESELLSNMRSPRGLVVRLRSDESLAVKTEVERFLDQHRTSGDAQQAQQSRQYNRGRIDYRKQQLAEPKGADEDTDVEVLAFYVEGLAGAEATRWGQTLTDGRSVSNVSASALYLLDKRFAEQQLAVGNAIGPTAVRLRGWNDSNSREERTRSGDRSSPAIDIARTGLIVDVSAGDTTESLTVDALGFIKVAGAGSLQVAGLSAEQIKQAVLANRDPLLVSVVEVKIREPIDLRLAGFGATTQPIATAVPSEASPAPLVPADEVIDFIVLVESLTKPAEVAEKKADPTTQPTTRPGK
jgi:hypothetical protein